MWNNWKNLVREYWTWKKQQTSAYLLCYGLEKKVQRAHPFQETTNPWQRWRIRICCLLCLTLPYFCVPSWNSCYYSSLLDTTSSRSYNPTSSEPWMFLIIFQWFLQCFRYNWSGEFYWNVLCPHCLALRGRETGSSTQSSVLFDTKLFFRLLSHKSRQFSFKKPTHQAPFLCKYILVIGQSFSPTEKILDDLNTGELYYRKKIPDLEIRAIELLFFFSEKWRKGHYLL